MKYGLAVAAIFGVIVLSAAALAGPETSPLRRRWVELPEGEVEFFSISRAEDIARLVDLPAGAVQALSIGTEEDGAEPWEHQLVLSEKDMRTLARLDELKRLILNVAFISREAALGLSKLPSLKELQIDATRLDPWSFDGWEWVIGLESLHLVGLTDWNGREALGVLERMTGLRSVVIDWPNWEGRDPEPANYSPGDYPASSAEENVRFALPGNLPKLEFLEIRGVLVCQEMLDRLAGQDRLKRLVLVGTGHFTRESPGLLNFPSLLALEDLEIEGAEFVCSEGIPTKSLGSVRRLKLATTVLDLNAARAVSAIRNLEVLEARNCWQNGGGFLEAIGPMNSLRILDLEFMYSDPGGLDGVARLPELRELRLSGYKIKDSGQMNALRGLKHIERLEMAGHGIDDSAVDCLAPLRSLKHMELLDTWMSAKGERALRAALPECEFYVEFSDDPPPSATQPTKPIS